VRGLAGAVCGCGQADDNPDKDKSWQQAAEEAEQRYRERRTQRNKAQLATMGH
jgi:hypothetical protein